MNQEGVVRHIKRQIGKRSQAEFAKSLGISAAYLCDVLADPPRRKIGPKLLRALGIDREITYRVSEDRP